MHGLLIAPVTANDTTLGLPPFLIEREKGADNIDADAIAHRLRDDLNEQRGVLHRKVAISYPSKLLDSALRVFRHRGLPVTTMQLSLTGRHVYCGCKGGSVTK